MKTKNFNKTTCAVWAAVLALAVSLTSPTTTRAANITWGAAANITGDTNVDTNGSLFGAIHLGDNGSLGGGALSNATVSGVNFQAPSINGLAGQTTAALGNFSLAAQSTPPGDKLLTLQNGNFGFGSSNSPFSTLSSSYQSILGSAVFINGPDTMALTISNLTVGARYEFEWFANYSGPSSDNHIAQAGASGNTISLNDNTSVGAADGGLGQYAIGTFVADATTQLVTFEAPAGANQQAQVNALQVRGLPDSMNTLIGLGLAVAGVLGFSALERQRRTLQKV